MKDPYFSEVYNQKILRKLAKRFGPTLYHHVNISASAGIMQQLIEKKMKGSKSRRGEVVMVIPNEQGDIWLHTKEFYPAGVFRLMSGGVETGESAPDTLVREAKEETGFDVTIDRCLAVVTYKFSNKGQKLPFVSYVLLTTSKQGQPSPTTDGEPIDGFRAIPADALFETAEMLRQLDGDFAEWGVFRAIAHELAGQALLLNKSRLRR